MPQIRRFCKCTGMAARPVRSVVKYFAVLSSAVGAASIAQIVRETFSKMQLLSLKIRGKVSIVVTKITA